MDSDTLAGRTFCGQTRLFFSPFWLEEPNLGVFFFFLMYCSGCGHGTLEQVLFNDLYFVLFNMVYQVLGVQVKNGRVCP